ncbi:MAG: polysaccharide deacetylase family protein [Bradyrhizobiaceae bacterium]|nr:MAG: polysaccharide deacetylase family protein [Bradyrhizobiaceae bacterium]
MRLFKAPSLNRTALTALLVGSLAALALTAPAFVAPSLVTPAFARHAPAKARLAKTKTAKTKIARTSLGAAALGTAALSTAASDAAAPATAASDTHVDCPGNPNALGTSRTLVVDPTEHPRIGVMQYHETLPLKDHEVVLTFDDGPLPAHTKPVLAMLAAECIKATFFIIGQQAQYNPQALRDVAAAGHTIGTHTQNHILKMDRMPIEQAKAEIDNGIASTAAALGDSAQVAPFFRVPGLLRSNAVEGYLASKGIMTWSADFLADDWRHISSARVAELAIRRLEAYGRGVLLLHDIQARTQAALPTILRELKARGYRIVHVVPSTPELPKTPSEPWEWHIHPHDPGQLPAVASRTPDMRFAFDPPKLSLADTGLRSVSIGIPTPARASTRSDLTPIWHASTIRADDAAMKLLEPGPETFEFGEEAPKLSGAKIAPGTPQE